MKRWPISVLSWRLSRLGFWIYVGLFAILVGAFALTDDERFFIYGAFVLFLSPLFMSMRLKDTGLSAFLPLPLFGGFIFFALQLAEALASASGAPRGSTRAPDPGAVLLEYAFLYLMVGALGVLTIYCLAAKSRPISTSHEVPQ